MRLRRLRRLLLALALATLGAAILIGASGHDPLSAFAALASGAAGTPHQLGASLNRAAPYLLAGSGVALCFRANVINIGAEGQIAIGGMAAAAAALAVPQGSLTAVCSLLAAALAGGAWAGLATAIHLARRVHEVLVTLLLNFIALLLVQQALAGPLGEPGAGFLQSSRMPPAAWLPSLDTATGAGPGFLVGVAVSILLSFLLWRTPFGFGLRVLGASRHACAYAGFSPARLTWGAMLLAGGAAGLAGGMETLGAHRRLIDGFSTGFGFKAVTVALLATMEPLAVIPAALFLGALETGSLSMQRQVGVPSSLVAVLEGMVMLFALAALARREGG